MITPETQGSVWCIVLGGGSGARFGPTSHGLPKQFLTLPGPGGEETLLERVVRTALEVVDGVVIVLPAGLLDHAAHLDQRRPGMVVRAAGGQTRAESVRAGLGTVPQEAGVIVVADSAHPLASPALFRRVVDAVAGDAAAAEALEERIDGAIPGIPLTEVIAEVDSQGTRTGGLAREGRVLVQTPQAFRAAALRAAHDAETDAVEDSAMVAARGGRVAVVTGEVTNVHVTTPEDLSIARALASAG